MTADAVGLEAALDALEIAVGENLRYGTPTTNAKYDAARAEVLRLASGAPREPILAKCGLCEETYVVAYPGAMHQACLHGPTGGGRRERV